ncbi:hypothetical protein [Klebsiella variicola]
MTNNQLTDERVTSVIERLEHYACSLKWTNVRGAQDLLTAADGLRELQERRKPLQDKDLQGVIDALEHPAGINAAGKQVVRHALVEIQERRKAERDSNPVGWTDEAELRDVEKDGCGYLFKANPITPHADPRRVIPLYRHAQPAPVVPDDVLDALQKVARIRLDLNDFDGDRRGIADCLCDAEEALIEVVNRRAATLAAAPQEVPDGK